MANTPVDIANHTSSVKQKDSQAYHNYLHYLDEWVSHIHNQKYELTQSYIFCMANKQQIITCNCKQQCHQLSLMIDPVGDVIVDVKMGQLNVHTCWFKGMSKTVSDMLNGISRDDLRLPTFLEDNLNMIVQLKLSEKSFAPVRLPFNIFREVCWYLDEDKVKRHSAIGLMQSLDEHYRKRILEKKARHVPEVKSLVRKQVLLHYIEDDHSLHIFLVATGMLRERVIAFINGQRRILGSQQKLSQSILQEEIDQCTKCKSAKYNPKLSVQGIYYAPPGLGKTTAQEKGLLCGLDTDWIGTGLTWKDYGPMLTEGIPIITNQYAAFTGCGLKIVGIYGPHVRGEERGKPLTSENEIKTAQARHRTEMTIFYVDRGKYVSDYAGILQCFSLLQQIIAHRVLNILPFPKTD